MASVAEARPSLDRRERVFFLFMALAIAAAVVGGFGIRILLGITNFDRPWWTHVHAVSFMAWTGFYVLQNILVVRGDTTRHMLFGRIGAVAALWICFVGMALTAQDVATGGVPPFFQPTYFLAQNWLYVVFFAGLTYAAIALRHRPDWHKRLMLCATLVVAIPGFARWVILFAPPPDATKHLITVAIFFIPAISFDLATRGRVHTAYWAGGGAILLMKGLTPVLAAFPPFAALANWIAS